MDTLVGRFRVGFNTRNVVRPRQVLPVVSVAECAVDKLTWGPGESLIHARRLGKGKKINMGRETRTNDRNGKDDDSKRKKKKCNKQQTRTATIIITAMIW